MEIDKILKMADSGLTAIEIIDIIDKTAKQEDEENNIYRLLGKYKGLLMCVIIKYQSKTIYHEKI